MATRAKNSNRATSTVPPSRGRAKRSITLAADSIGPNRARWNGKERAKSPILEEGEDEDGPYLVSQ